MRTPGVPVVLVHGWKSHPRIWNRLIQQFKETDVEYWNFDHAVLSDAPLGEVSAALGGFIALQREEWGYTGAVDMVCHSMGGSIARYLIEVLDGRRREESVRQVIEIGSPNHGSAMAELFNDPEHGPAILQQLAGVFVPPHYDPSMDPIVQDFRPRSRAMHLLRDAGLRGDITYRMILSGNPTATPALFPCFKGRTWELSPEGAWRMTFAGDGIVPHSECFLPGVGTDILPTDPASLSEAPDRYCHIHLPRNPEVIQRVLKYLGNPSPQPCSCDPEITH
ncbi:MAG TPA: acetyltransferase [Methanomicrobiales archaeon]|nr:acetyltransferase [Methanomicrobiales archaeon]